MKARFANRIEAAQELAGLLTSYAGQRDVLVLGLPRGGVPLAKEIARQLHVLWDVFIVRKLGVPGHAELAMGAIATGGVQVLNEEVLQMFPKAVALLQETADREMQELERREKAYRGGRPFPDIKECTVIIVDDGIATGATVLVAARALRQLGASKIVVAAPVGAAESCERLEEEVDAVVCVTRPSPFRAVGAYYDDFSPVEDAEVQELLSPENVDEV